jgi:hypothetical protein
LLEIRDFNPYENRLRHINYIPIIYI